VLDTNLHAQEETNLEARANAVAAVVRVKAETAAKASTGDTTVVSARGALNDYVRTALDPTTLTDWANNVGRADLSLRIGLGSATPGGPGFIPATPISTFNATLTVEPARGQARDPISYTQTFDFADPAGVEPTWQLEVSLASPYTTRSTTITSVIGFLLIVALGALLMAVIVATLLARRFTLPLRRLTQAARAVAEGDLARRVPVDGARTGAAEITELSRQFNAMAEQVEETMEVIRRDRDASREFLADVSHELRTPLAALRTFNELLRERAGDDVDARTEFLESSAQQIERLDWLAQNLLELSKLDSGLIRLDLRPDDLRATVLSAVEQAQVSAKRRGINLTDELPDSPLITRHDPQRLGQVLVNLIGNALKFTPRGGSVRVTMTPRQNGARIAVIDTGIGIEAKDLPRIFERFYRGSRASEARSSGSGLGLAIVRSIVEMHRGRIMVESRVGAGSTFVVTLPADPRTAPEPTAEAPTTVASVAKPAVEDPKEQSRTRTDDTSL
jgi:signal transduction histidine kinase